QTDYDRHFEELLERVETLLIGILRMRLNKETLDQVAHYHSLLENVRRLSAGDGKTMETTMSTETKLFLRKTEELSTLVTAMKTLQAPCELELLEIEEKLTDLSIAMEKDKCLNAGGKFEWVDSVLVKCLQNGTWLLLDQVNLCSPAILDRLNGLLEPNGALTIGEKGVDQGGNVFTVKAHKNFRLFLAMDPRHGEISRAMRNRGVEISIPTPHHVLPCNPLDVASLLNSCGIRSVDHQKLIEKIHESLYDKQYKLNEMLQVASFTSQQMLKGFTFERSLRNSYRELCGTFDWRSRKEASRKIEEILSEYAENEGGAEVLYDLNAITLRMCDLRRNARLAVIRQQGFLLKYAVEKLSDDCLMPLLTQLQRVKVSHVLKQHLLLDFYERSSLDDLQIRRMWSCDTFSKNKLNELAEINEYLSGEVENLEFLFRNKSALEVPLSLLEPTTLSNNLTIAMYFRLMTLECQSEKNLQKKKDIIDLKEYSSAVCSGRLSTNLKNEPLILKFAELIEQSGKIIDIVLHDEHLSINDKEYVELRDSLKSYIRFHDLGTIELVDKSQGTFFDLREIISSLEVHYKWLVVSIVENSTVREKLIEICVKKFKDTGEGSNSAQDLVEIDELAGKIADVTEIRENSGKMSEDSREVEMWPIYEFFFLLFTYRFQGKFCEEFSNIEEISQKFHRDSSNEISDTLMICDESNEKTGETFGKIYDERVLKKFEEVPTIPAHLISLMKALNSDETMPKQRISLFLELLFFIEEFTERSFAVKNSNVLLHWHDRTETEEGEKDATNILETSFMNKSTLCNLIFELFLTKSGNRREIINFGNYKYQKRLLKSIQTLLWKNSLILNSNEFNISKNDSILLQFYMNYYLSAIKKVINANEEQKDLKDRFIEPMKLLQKIQEKMKNENSVVERGNGWLILGYLQIFLFHDLGSIDPVQKIALKSKYIRENISELEYLICVENLQSVILATCLSKDRKLSRVNHLNESSNEAKNFENFHAARPTSSFQNLREEIGNFAGNIGSFDTIFKQMNHLNDVAEQLQRKESLASHREKLHEAMIWKRSLERFSGKLEKNFLVGFPDLVSPMIAAISNLHRGVSILIHELSNMQFQSSNSDVCYNLLRFPAVGLCQESYINLVKLCSSEKLVFILAKQSISKSVQKDRFTMSKIALKELENLSLVARDRLKSLWEELNKIFMKIRILWKEQEKQREEEMKEKQSLFKTKIGTKEEEESDFRKMFPGFQQDFLELAEMFPGSQQDFQELQRIPESVSDEKESFVELISTKDARKIQEIHWNILRNSSFSEKNSKTSLIRRSKSSLKASEANSEPDFIEPLIERFQLLGPSVNTWSENLSSQLVCSLNVLISQKCSFDDRKGDKEVYDFYRDPNIPEIEECQPCFDKFCARINELLKEWPENPILNSIKLIVDRLFSFSVDSSLSRFLVGVELLLTKIQQWEENAHLGVSLAEFIQFFGEKILRWRKLEISRWKDSLEVLEDDLKTEASKWWFFLFNLIDQYLIDDIEQSLVEQSDILEDVKQSEVSKEKMIESLERFLTESTLIEFEARLQLIYLFYQHIGYLKESKKQKELSAILWNVYFYYNQFLGDVQNKIKVLKEPVAKKLKDTIKITRWNDISYWSVKNTAEKTRRTLHKFVKEFQKGLKENVASCLTLKTKAETLEMSSRRELNSSDFVINTQSGKLKKIQKLTHKARLFCENIIVRSNYPQIRKDIETFIEESLEESKRLKNLEVDKTLTKAKQQSQLKSMLQQKKMALANYFKTLSRLGISYRIGILTWKNRKNQITNFTCTPLDLQEIQRFEFKGFENKNVEKGLIEQWSDCNRYYYESLVKFNFLDGILNSGKSDLGIQNAERCRGLSVHLVLLAHRQKETIANFFKHFLPFRIQVSNLIVMRQDAIKKVSHANVSRLMEILKRTDEETVNEPENINIPRQKNLQIVMKNFQALLEVLQISVRQSIIFLESCPMESLAEENLLDLNEAAVAVLKENSVSTDLITSMKDSLNLIKYMASELNTWITISKRVEESGQVFLLHQRHIDFLQASYQKISEIKRRLIDFSCIQQKSIEGTDDPEKESTDDVDFQENLITEGLIESLKKDVPDLRLKTISQIFGELMKIIEDSDVKSANDYTRSLLQHVPLLEQYVLFLHYYLHEQVASFRLTCKFLYLQLNVFLDLAIHGFCQPDNMDAPKDDQESGIKEGGMGLAEGEGQKDISDQIESEDQLEETRGPNEEEKDKEKKDTKEEEKGIEMSENFEGHLQELEPREEEEENNEEDDELDKEMGETDETAEKLDEEIWKDEEEEEEEENQDEENKKEEKGTGEKTGQEELSAKDDTDKNKDKDEDEESGEKKEEEEKKEINELDEPEANDDQIDPYHGKHQPEPEPEAFDLPEDINLDEEMKEDNPEGEEENPFDIDEMKEPRIPEEKENEESEEKEGPEEDKEQDSDDNDDEGAEAEEEDPNAESNKRKDEKVKDPDEDKKDEADEQNLEEENQPEEEKAPASSDAGSKEVDAAQEPESRKDGSRDAVARTGQSQTEEREGHSGSKQEENAPTTGEEITSKAVPKRRKPGESNEDRSLLDDDTQPSAKKLKTALTQKNIDRCEERETNEGGGESTTYEHIKNTEKFDDYVFDAATEEQVKKQASNLEEDKMDDKLEDEDTKMHEDPIEEDKEEEAKKEQSQKLPESKKEKSTNVRGQRSDDIEQMEVEGEVEGETVETTRVLRGNESSIHTKLPETESYDISTNDIAQRRSEIENMLSQLSQGSSSVEAANAWSSISALTESAARELSEKLRLVLEPTLTSRLKGDYRTGRRINMRKVIPYIASEFRKDKIWLRRTKPSKRDYQIVLAIDDSSSMADNHSKELAFESLSLIGKAMTYLEIGQLAVVNFGERVNILHPFGENFTDESGARLIQEMKFEQKKTMIGQLLDFMIEMFSSQSSSSDNAKLVTILSDGRGIFSEGVENVNAAVRRAKLLNIFLVFIVVDNPLSKDSILDIRMPVFENGKLLGIRSYMDNFPFPFYIILRDLDTLPVVLSDALRQWFEIVGRSDT
ncbi:Midasin, partial [Habropoda laboriosa]